VATKSISLIVYLKLDVKNWLQRRMTVVIAHPGELDGGATVALAGAVVNVGLERADDQTAEAVGIEHDVRFFE
jgi:hypothetical protein